MTFQATPRQLVFSRHTIFLIQFEADWASIALRKQNLINKSNAHENSKRKLHEYKIGDNVLLERPGNLHKLSMPRQGPYDVVEVGSNGTIHLRKGNVIQMVNIRRVMPFLE